LLAFWLLACGPSRDVVPESREVRGAESVAAQGTYAYVARRPHGIVGLAEARGIVEEVAERAVDRLADELERCAVRLAEGGQLAEGAARVVAYVDENGAVGKPLVKASPGAGVVQNALVCIVSPMRLLGFPPAAADAGAAQRGIAIEARWGAPRGGTP
jgi:hypothetical protein